MDYFDTLITISVISGIIVLIVANNESILSMIGNFLLAESAFSMFILVIIQPTTSLNDELLTFYSFFMSVALIGIGINYLVAQHDKLRERRPR